jgi:DNA-directed RNA polymerase subunit RPC12/RpoP
MATCSLCGKEYSEARYALGFTVCPKCGDKAALEEIQAKQSRVGVIANKGGEEYLGSPETTRKLLLTAGSRKNIPLQDSAQQSHSLAGSYQRSYTKRKWVFSHHTWYWNPKTQRREFRAVLKEIKQ